MTIQDLFSLKGQVALVTGASGQLGHQISNALFEAGAHLILTDLDMEKGRQWAEAHACEQQKIICMEMDIMDRQAIETVKDRCLAEFNRLDILINNAGIGIFTPFETRTDEEFQQVCDVNLKGTFHTIQIFSKIMQQRKFGSIINIGSIYGVVSCDPRIYGDSGRNSSEVYAATKAGIIHMTRYYAVHLASSGIRVNAISPGGVFNNQKESFVKNYENRTPLGRMANDEDIKGAIVYLASGASKYVTGHNLIVDGGFSIW